MGKTPKTLLSLLVLAICASVFLPQSSGGRQIVLPLNAGMDGLILAVKASGVPAIPHRDGVILQIANEGTAIVTRSEGFLQLDCVGAGIDCTVSGAVVTVTVDGAGSINFADLADVTDGVPHDYGGAVEGNTLCFDDVGGGVLNVVPCSTVWSGYIDLDAASCIATTATNNFNDSPTLTEPAAACASFTSTTVGLSDFDAAADEGYQLPLVLPGDWTGAIDADFYWIAAATSGAAAWGIQVGCAAADDPLSITFNTASVVSDTAMGTTNELNIASVTGITTTGCAANELMFVQVYRDADGTAATDDMTGDARLLKVRLKYRRSVVP